MKARMKESELFKCSYIPNIFGHSVIDVSGKDLGSKSSKLR